jgi:hypothetical protein
MKTPFAAAGISNLKVVFNMMSLPIPTDELLRIGCEGNIRRM